MSLDVLPGVSSDIYTDEDAFMRHFAPFLLIAKLFDK